MFYIYLFSLIFSQNRIVSLSPETTSILVDLGLKNKLVCIAGPDNLNIKKVGPYHRPSLEKILACNPDFVIATYSGTPPLVYNKLKTLGIDTVLYKAKKLEDISKFIKYLNTKFKLSNSKLENSFKNLCIKAKKSAAVLVGFNPMFAAGSETFISDALNCAGYKNIIRGTYKKISIENLIKAECLIISTNYSIDTKNYKLLKDVFKNKIININPDLLSQANLNIVKGINILKNHKI